MKTKTYRKFAALAAGVAVTLGAVAIAPSATADERGFWAGSEDCPNQHVAATGRRAGGNGEFWVIAGDDVRTRTGDYGPETMTAIASWYGNASWEVGGNMAVEASVSCTW